VQSKIASIYMGENVELATLQNGAITNAKGQEQLRQALYMEPQIEKVVPGVTVFGGFAFVNFTLIEGKDGLIVYDAGENLSEGESLLEEIRKVSDKPIVAIIYSHSHYVHGTSAIVGDAHDVLIIGHPKVNANADSRGSSYYEEMSPLQKSRAGQQFARLLPKTGPMAAAGANIIVGRSGYRPVNTPVEDGQRMTVAGVEMVFYTSYGSDTDDCLTVHLPQHGVVLNNLFWPFLPNIYTLRGAKFRDPAEWHKGLELIRDLQPDALINTHAKTIRGASAVNEALGNFIDTLRAILDQTLRGILHGLGPDDLRTFVRLPRHLAELPYLAETYGELAHYGPYIYNHALGWFDGDAATINPLSKSEEADLLVQAMGGARLVLEKARSAFAAKQFSWAAQLVNYLYRMTPSDRAVRSLKADVLEQMGRVTPAQTTRNWYMSQARALRGDLIIPQLAFLDEAILSGWSAADTMSHYRVRVDPEKSADKDVMVAMSIADRGVRHAWHLRRGVVEFIEDVDAYRRAPHHEIRSTLSNWLKFFSCRISQNEFLSNCVVAPGDEDSIGAFFASFDDLGQTIV